MPSLLPLESTSQSTKAHSHSLRRYSRLAQKFDTTQHPLQFIEYSLGRFGITRLGESIGEWR